MHVFLVNNNKFVDVPNLSVCALCIHLAAFDVRRRSGYQFGPFHYNIYSI